ncbi:hypothetical protein Zmor_005322 [Zophobas morio]|uniref:Uncharacterized protein n=1 Tax=Zophobas morio TaxID=2755281 RepID=A0AA38IRW6_9CUCU|nr:hypothetical protein Zmor_005322 [Zophobas morio]
MKSLSFYLVLLVTVCSSIKLPPTFQKCDKTTSNFDDCLGKVIHDALNQLDKPFPEYGLPSLQEAEVPPDVVAEFGNSTYGLRQKFSNYKLFGLTKPNLTKARMDFKTNTLVLNVSFPEIVFRTDYEAEGAVFILPVNIATTFEGLLVKPTFNLVFKLQEYENEGRYFKVVDTDFDMNAENFKLEFKRLAPNKRLNYELNAAINEKGVEIFARFKHLQVFFEPYFGGLFDGLLKKVEIKELFDGV